MKHWKSFIVGDVLKYSDPLLNESEVFIPNSVKYQLVISEEDNLKNALDQLEKLETLKVDSLLDSTPIQSKLNFVSLLYNWNLYL